MSPAIIVCAGLVLGAIGFAINVWAYFNLRRD